VRLEGPLAGGRAAPPAPLLGAAAPVAGSPPAVVPLVVPHPAGGASWRAARPQEAALGREWGWGCSLLQQPRRGAGRRSVCANRSSCSALAARGARSRGRGRRTSPGAARRWCRALSVVESRVGCCGASAQPMCAAGREGLRQACSLLPKRATTTAHKRNPLPPSSPTHRPPPLPSAHGTQRSRTAPALQLDPGLLAASRRHHVSVPEGLPERGRVPRPAMQAAAVALSPARRLHARGRQPPAARCARRRREVRAQRQRPRDRPQRLHGRAIAQPRRPATPAGPPAACRPRPRSPLRPRRASTSTWRRWRSRRQL
jgi:hypothetical protein